MSEKFLQMRKYSNNALIIVGRGLHSIQDMGAHLDFGVTSNNNRIFAFTGVHRVQGENTFILGVNAITNLMGYPLFDSLIFDNPRYNVFRDSNGTWQASDSGSAYGSDRCNNQQQYFIYHPSRYLLNKIKENAPHAEVCTRSIKQNRFFMMGLLLFISALSFVLFQL